jgi:hypothetical protein
MKLEKSLIYLRLAVITVMSVVIQAESNAQRFSAGLLGGLNASQIDGDNLAGFDKVGLTGGILTTMEFESPFRMNMEFLYSERGSRPDIFNPEYDPDIEISLKYVELPVYVSLGDWWQEEGEYYKVSVHGGLSYGRLLNAKTTDYYNSAEESYDQLVQYFSENDLSWLLGMSLRMSKSWGITARYSRGIIPLLDADKHDLATSDLRTYWLTFRFEYYFN